MTARQFPIHFINPNSSAKVTGAIKAAVDATPVAALAAHTYVTTEDGPEGVITQADSDLAATLVTRYVRQHEADASAFVIACFSDPGVFAASGVTSKPVVGIGRAGLLCALSFGQSVGVIAVAKPSIPRHMRYWRALNLQDCVAGERALDLRVDQSGDFDIAFQRMVEVGRKLIDEDGADVVLLGCAGMANLRRPLQDALGVAVIDPCQAAAMTAAAQIALLGPRD